MGTPRAQIPISVIAWLNFFQTKIQLIKFEFSGKEVKCQKGMLSGVLIAEGMLSSAFLHAPRLVHKSRWAKAHESMPPANGFKSKA